MRLICITLLLLKVQLLFCQINLMSGLEVEVERSLGYTQQVVYHYDDGKAGTNDIGLRPLYNIRLGIPLTSKITLGVAWRKQVFFDFVIGGGIGLGQSTEMANVFPFSMSFTQKLGKKRPFSLISATISGGVNVALMHKSELFPLITNQYFRNPNNGVVIQVEYNESDINQVNSALLPEGRLLFSHDLNKYIQVYYGYNFTHGFKLLSKGTFTYNDPSGIKSGSVFATGTTRFKFIGFRFTFGKKNDKVKASSSS